MARTFGDLGNCRTGPHFDEHYKQPLLKMPMMKRKAYLLIKILQMSKYRLRQLSSRAVAFSLFLASSSGSSHSTRISTTLKKQDGNKRQRQRPQTPSNRPPKSLPQMAIHASEVKRRVIRIVDQLCQQLQLQVLDQIKDNILVASETRQMETGAPILVASR
jgi:hypothetical protein